MNDFFANDREDVQPFLSVFFYIALQYSLSVRVCVRACVCVVRTYSRPYGRRQTSRPLPLQILGLNAEAKKRKKKKKILKKGTT